VLGRPVARDTLGQPNVVQARDELGNPARGADRLEHRVEQVQDWRTPTKVNPMTTFMRRKLPIHPPAQASVRPSFGTNNCRKWRDMVAEGFRLSCTAPERWYRLAKRVAESWPTERDLALFDFNPREAVSNAVQWIRRAHAAAGDGGVSKGYDLIRGSWSPSYPETTGYTITTLLNASNVLERPELRALAISLAEYLLKVRTPEGGVAHWAADSQKPIVFDTGQALFGWLAAFRATGDERFLDASVRAGDWLTATQHNTGCWTIGQHLDVPKVIDTRVAWALLELFRITGEPSLQRAAERNLNWAITQQEVDGWFRSCAFTPGADPFTHTIAYTAEGLFESSLLLHEPKYFDAARKAADGLAAELQADGHLNSTFGSGWRATSRSCCLTGNCQMSRLWLLLHQRTEDDRYLRAARKAIKFVAWTQARSTFAPETSGGIAGSYPLWGRYERFKYPNWAAKFFVDAVLSLDQFATGHSPLTYVG